MVLAIQDEDLKISYGKQKIHVKLMMLSILFYPFFQCLKYLLIMDVFNCNAYLKKALAVYLGNFGLELTIKNPSESKFCQK